MPEFLNKKNFEDRGMDPLYPDKINEWNTMWVSKIFFNKF